MQVRAKPTESPGHVNESGRLRIRIARDLHDGVGTTLSLIALYSAVAEREHNLTELKRIASAIRRAAATALADLRAVLQALPEDPVTLDDLAAGMALLGKRSAESIGATLDVAVDNVAGVVVAGAVRTTIVRIFQEAVHNAVRHGQARHIRTSLVAEAHHVELIIEDDGIGFDPSLNRGGSGIEGMRARAVEVDGELSVRSVKNVGSRLRLRLPITAAGDE